MTTKRELISKIKAHKKNRLPLSASECDELISLLDGPVRDRKRPEVKIFGVNRRRGNRAALGDMVYRAFYKAEQLAELEVKLKTETEPQARSELKRIIEELKPMCAKNETEAINLAVDHFNHWLRSPINSKFIQREVTQLKKEAKAQYKGKFFWLNEWPKIKAVAEAEGKRRSIKLVEETDNLHF